MTNQHAPAQPAPAPDIAKLIERLHSARCSAGCNTLGVCACAVMDDAAAALAALSARATELEHEIDWQWAECERLAAQLRPTREALAQAIDCLEQVERYRLRKAASLPAVDAALTLARAALEARHG